MEATQPKNEGKFWRHVAQSLLLILLSALVGTGLLILSEFLPAEPMDQHLDSSADIFQATGKFPNLHTWCSSKLDNYSDAIMLLMAGNVSSEHSVEYAMMSYHGVMGEFDPVQIFVKHYIEGEEYEGFEPYSRYWHGYSVIYRLLLQVLDYHRIRQLNMALQVGLVLLLCLLMWRSGSRPRGMILPLLISYAMLAPAVMGLNLEYSLGFYISLLSVLTLLLLHRKGRMQSREYLVFLFSGICTAYWDVLTYPMAALGLPLVVAFYLAPDRKLRDALLRLLRLGFFWGMGYGLLWVMKWVIGTALTGFNVFEEGLSTFLMRTGDEAYGEVVTLGATLWGNIRFFFNTPFTLLFLGYLLFLILRLLRKTPREGAARQACLRQLVPFLLIACIPFAWCVLTKNHAYIHYWLASKAFIVSTMALMCGLYHVNQSITKPFPEQGGL